MTRLWPILALGAALIVVSIVRADAAAPAGSANGKIGFVDLQRTLRETSVGKKAAEHFEKQRKSKQNELDERQKELQKFAEELNKQRLVLKPEILRERQRELEKKYYEVQETYLRLERDLAESKAKLLHEIFRKAEPVIKTIAQQEGYAIVLDRSAVFWGLPSNDITDEVNRRLK